MSKNISLNEVIEEIYQSILETPKKLKRLKSSTFWNKFGIERRTQERIDQVKKALEKRSIFFNIEDSHFGTESRQDWITLSYLEVEPPQLPTQEIKPNEKISTPTEDWFKQIENRQFESEREVEYFFIIPLLKQLNYTEGDLAIGFRVRISDASKHFNKEADIVAFDDKSHTNALLLIEAKNNSKLINNDDIAQARYYCRELLTPYYIVTNGEETRVYLYRGAALLTDFLLMNFKRSTIRQNWNLLYKNLNKSAILQHKQKLKQRFEDSEI